MTRRKGLRGHILAWIAVLATSDLAAGNVATGNVATGNVAAGNLATGNLATSDLAAGNVAAGNLATGNLAASDLAASDLAASNVAAAPPRPPSARLSLREARRYMVDLINRDRASFGLAPVVLDEGSAERAGQGHAEDMASRGFLGHWGSDGSVPEQRLTEAGGNDMVLENASCFTDERSRPLDPSPGILATDVELAEKQFFDEKPPHDGHRKNILKPWHKRVGIGVAQPTATPQEIPSPCFAQEFVDAYGSYAPLPKSLRVGASVHVEGTLDSSVTFAGVGLARTPMPSAIPLIELNRRRSYAIPVPYQTYWPAGFKTPIPVRVDGRHFAVDLPLSDHGRSGLYEVSVWATVPGSPDLVMVSLRTIRAR